QLAANHQWSSTKQSAWHRHCHPRYGGDRDCCANIPFNRFIGLRLPWTIRDEDTWNIAHRLLGSITFPLIVLVLIGGLTGKPETFIKSGIFSWIAVTGGY